MNIERFTKILQEQLLTEEDIKNLNLLTDQYPYFQSARALHLKGLKNTEDSKYNQALKTTAAYTTDRSILFDYITSEAFIQNKISKHIKQNTINLNTIPVEVEDISINKKVIIDNALRKEIENTKPILDPALFQPKQTTNHSSLKPKNNGSKDEKPEVGPSKNFKIKPVLKESEHHLGKPFEFNKSERYSFNEWLNLTHKTPIKRETPPKITAPKKTINRAKKFKLIDQFISKNHKLEPTKATSSENIANAQMIQPETLMTETLARIYLEQKNYKKAIQSYKILSLKYPEKSSFFANQIKVIKQLQENNT